MQIINYFNYQNQTLELSDMQVNITQQILNELNGIFKYENLPDTLIDYLIERNLFWSGHCLITKAIDGNIYCGTLQGAQEYDINFIPIKGTFITENAKYQQEVEIGKDAVLIFANVDAIPTYFTVRPFIDKLEKIFTIDNNNLLLSNKKVVIQGSPQEYDKKISDVEQLLKPTPYLFMQKLKRGVDKYAVDKIQDTVMNMAVAYEPSKYDMHYRSTKALMYEAIGIFHNSSEKKERNVTNEVNLNTNSTNLILANSYEMRLKGIEKVNKLFGLNIKLTNQQQERMEAKTEGQEDNIDNQQDKEVDDNGIQVQESDI